MEERDDTVYLHSKINEIFATTESIQYFTNILNNPIELTIYIPIIEEITLMKFVISINEKIIISKVLSKEKEKEKYTDAISSGNEGINFVKLTARDVVRHPLVQKIVVAYEKFESNKAKKK